MEKERCSLMGMKFIRLEKCQFESKKESKVFRLIFPIDSGLEIWS